MNLLIVLLLGIVSIFFLLIGTLIVFSLKNNKKIVTFSVSLGFIVLILLGIFHLIPDAYSFFRSECSKVSSILYIIIVSLIGFIVVLILDKFSGHHHEHEKKESEHFKHISLITCIFLVVHNFIEGMTLYGTVLVSYDLAAMLTLGIGLHNIPLGLTLSSTYSKNHSKIQTFLFVTLIGLSYLVGALISYKFSYLLDREVIMGIILMITFGMIMYIAIFEFLPVIKESNLKSMKYLGFIVGIITMVITLFL